MPEKRIPRTGIPVGWLFREVWREKKAGRGEWRANGKAYRLRAASHTHRD
jgi:hypothetical protein